MSEDTILTCAYCMHQYPDGTPAAKHELLTEHIKICDKHPMREAELKIEQLRNALIGIIGASTDEELNAMELTIRSASIPDSDKTITINAIDALRSCP